MLILKVEKYGVKGDSLLWIKNFLKDRKQRVTIGDSWSNWTPVTSGIPREPIGPNCIFDIIIMLTSYQGSLTTVSNSLQMTQRKFFADDAKMYQKFNTYVQASHRQCNVNN